ncbi:amino acid adenylation domain-containing protein [Streptomonospora sp. S1-112]|uniref:Amino acid adenylation domain-containing protein n=1 Tax=Streptomonospora mangrovi TaxID=2883123 RepID=A0A9X3NPN2_9ACTN|nr:polyketide synthase [Streptomonospora mangrovi]MDA0565644.1 amino acid adenylation domain-containing protein [Streptomonospora mangrovi]
MSPQAGAVDPLDRLPALELHRIFEHRAAAAPEAVAVVHGPRSVTYRELDRHADAVAARLRAAGAGPGSLVGIRTGRGPAMIASMVAVLKTGAAYVPVDPGDPEERFGHIAAEAGMGVLVTDDPEAAAPGGRPLRLVRPDADPTDAAAPAPAAPADPDAPAYVLFTSGSTGAPKGAAMTHRALANLLNWHDRTRPGTCALPTLQFCAVSFDFSVHEIFSTLCFGGTLVVADDAVRRDPFALVRFVAEHPVERLFLPVTPLTRFAEAFGERPLELAVREVVTTGERLRITPALRELFTRTGARLHNHYGATEFQDAAVHTLEPPAAAWPADVPAGRPIDNVAVHVLDADLRPVPDGREGELYIGGAGVSPGYVNRPDLTRERFVTGPGGTGRLYRTGDLARVGPGGVLEILGRADDQIKVNGVRVEPGEVEAALLEHPDVAEAAVAARGPAGRERLVAYVVPRAGADGDLARRLHRHTAERLPRALRPTGYEELAALPLTSSGKKDRRRLPEPTARERLLDTAALPPASEAERVLAGLWREILDLDEVGVEDNLFDAGGTSAHVVELRRAVAERLGVELSVVDVFRTPTIRALARRVSGGGTPAAAGGPRPHGAAPGADAGGTAGGDAVAVIGMALRFPGASGPEEFWANLVAGTESVTRFAEGELDQPDPDLAGHPDYVPAAPVIPGVELFDAAFFGIGAREAATMDPQQRLLLQCAWEACENAGYVPGAGSSAAVGVFAGSAMSTYLLNNVAPAEGFPARGPLTEADLRQFQLKLGNDRSYLATRVSYKLGLTGPSVNVQTACSTSLVAVHQACRSLAAGECDAALAGGVSVPVPQATGYLYEDGMIRSRDGHCRPFDAAAQGTLFGSGCGVVLLKRLADAIADGDHIHAVIRGSAVNNDGADKVGFTAPSVERQAEVVERALRAARVDPATVGYVEAHGTGTQVGDPIEIAALTEAFARAGGRPEGAGRCAVGSVKSNIGHLDEAAGIAGFIKAVLALRHGTVPPTLHLERTNPAIDFASSPFYVNTEVLDWPAGAVPRRAGVSSFGMGGTNCHVVLEEAPPPPARPAAGADAGPQVLPLSARTPDALADLARRHADHLAARPGTDLADAAATAATGRRHFEHRLAVVAGTPAEAAERLRRAADAAGAAPAPPGATAFLFGGQGSHYAGMGRELHASLPAFRAALEECAALMDPHLPEPLLDVLFAEGDRLTDTGWAQPAVFAVEYALARAWAALGMEPDAVLGHSLGEYTAACVAGVFPLADAARLVTARARLMAALPRGRMAAVLAGEDVVAPLVAAEGGAVAVAALNGARSTVVSGPPAAVERVCAALRERGVRQSPLAVSHAFHSPMMEPMLAEFAEAAATVAYSAPRLPIVSNVTGERVGAEIATPEYWVRHTREPVRFAAGLAALRRLGCACYVELSGRPSLLPLLAAETGAEAPGTEVRTASMHPRGERERFLGAVADLYGAGRDIDWSALHPPGTRRRVELPTYPWRAVRHWIDPPPRGARTPAPDPAAHPLLGARIDLAGSDEARFEAVVGPGTLPWLADHRVFDTVVLPGVAFMEISLAAAGALLGDGRGRELADTVIHRAMDFADGAPRTVQTLVAAEEAGTRALRVYSRPAGAAPGTPWTHHFSTRLHTQGAGAAPAPEAGEAWPAAAAGPGAEADPEVIYAGERARSIDLGPSFHATRRLWRADLAARSEIAAPEAIGGETGRYHAHPVLLEALFLALTVAYPAEHGHRTYVPAGVERLRAWAPLRGEVRCAARIRPVPAGAEAPETLLGDARLMAPDGRLLVELTGIVLKRAERRTMIGSAEEPWRAWLHRTVWRPLPLTPDGGAPGTHWVVLADADLGAGLRAAAGERGARCTVVTGSPAPDPGALAGADLVVDARPAALAGTAAGSPEAAAEHAVAVAALVRALARAPGQPPPLVLVTRGAHAVDAAPAAVPAQAAAWGVLRVAATEHDDLALGAVDLDPALDTADQLARLAAELAAAARAGGPGEPWTALRGGARHAARLVAAPPARTGAAPRVRAVAAYLVTGGLGGLGLRLARFLVERGARHLVLVGRSAPGAQARAALADLAAAGARVVVRRADVADPRAAAALLAAVDGDPDLPPLAGVAHLAGVLDDGALTELTPERFRRAMAPKAAGAWHLARHLGGRDLDFLVLYSSVSAVLGTPGQANYAAANAYLDALAARLRAEGVPALAVQWGSWAGDGMSARAEDTAKAARHGEYPMEPDDALAALAHLLAAPPEDAAVAVLRADWAVRAAAEGAVPRLLSELARPPREEPGPGGAPVWDVAAAPPRERRRLLADHLRRELSLVLGVAEDIDPAQGFVSLGLDSVASIELRNRVQRKLGRRLDLTLAYDHPTLDDLAAHLAEVVGADGPAPAVPAASAAGADARAGAAGAGGGDAARRLAAKLGVGLGCDD